MTRLRTVLLLLAAIALVGMPTAAAHSVVIGSSPEDGSTVDSAPTTASVTFNEAVQEQFASLTVVGPDGNLWSEGDPRVEGPTVSVDLRELGPAGT